MAKKRINTSNKVWAYLICGVLLGSILGFSIEKYNIGSAKNPNNIVNYSASPSTVPNQYGNTTKLPISSDISLTLPEGSFTFEVPSVSVQIGRNMYIVEISERSNSYNLLCKNAYVDACNYTDDNSNANLTTLRLWKNKNGVFALNPQGIQLNGKFFEKLVITKPVPDIIFSSEEIAIWKDILKNFTSNE